MVRFLLSQQFFEIKARYNYSRIFGQLLHLPPYGENELSIGLHMQQLFIHLVPILGIFIRLYLANTRNKTHM